MILTCFTVFIDPTGEAGDGSVEGGDNTDTQTGGQSIGAIADTS